MSYRESVIKLGADLIQRRDDMRRLLGTRYSEQVETARAILRGSAKEHGQELTAEALVIARKMNQAGVSPNLIFAALVEELESLAQGRGLAPAGGKS
jgi:hypothetical protein